jgi:SAM-dependent methyltransferase
MKFVVQENREEKALKIQAVLQDALRAPIKDLCILDIGIGNGEIAEFFARENKVCGVDVMDQRSDPKSLVEFHLVQEEQLPFENGSFDLVISNHAIEHMPNPRMHLSEIRRTLKNSGACYLATPNALFPWECHHKTWLVHYGGRLLYHRYLKWRKTYEEDLFLLTYFSLMKLTKSMFDIDEYTHRIIKEPHKYGFYVPALNRLPLPVLAGINFLSQTNVLILRPR